MLIFWQIALGYCLQSSPVIEKDYSCGISVTVIGVGHIICNFILLCEGFLIFYFAIPKLLYNITEKILRVEEQENQDLHYFLLHSCGTSQLSRRAIPISNRGRLLSSRFQWCKLTFFAVHSGQNKTQTHFHYNLPQSLLKINQDHSEYLY